MERKRGTTVAIVAALIIAVVSLGVAFAAFSTTLNINGTATVQSSSWDIYFTQSSNGSKPTSEVALDSTNITESNSQQGISETVTATGNVIATTLTWNATFKTPGDTVVYKVYVKNAGSFNAKVSNISLPNPTCKSGSPLTTETAVCAHIHYKLYTNSGCTTELTTNDTLNSGAETIYYLKAWLDNDGWATDGTSGTGTPLPTVDVVTDSIQATVTYSQATN